MIDPQNPKSIWLRSNRTLSMDSETTIESDVLLPSTEHKLVSGKAITGYGALLTISGNNIGCVGGQFLQETQDIQCNCCRGNGCNFAVDIYHSSGVTFRDSVTRGSYGSAVRVLETRDGTAGVHANRPPVETEWGLLAGLARQPVFITNVTLHHHHNDSFFNLRGFWTVMVRISDHRLSLPASRSLSAVGDD
jgi:hypothetical protein|eukprot:COSAG01_NODE_4390_length_5073_cov_6.057901_3_plen_192_part_00